MTFDIPCEYGDHKVVLMVRDPWTIFAYWETRKEVEDKVKDEIARRGLKPAKSVLRVYDITGTDPDDCSNIAFDFELKDLVNNWYIHCDPEKEWVADIGISCTNGEFFSLVRSNTAKTPSSRVSDIIDEEWMCLEGLYHKMIFIGDGKSSMSFREMVERFLQKWLSSGGISSGVSDSAKSRNG
ncbi:DUF4912 domain-containing protein [Candidatus Omnitrophota bacterium]